MKSAASRRRGAGGSALLVVPVLAVALLGGCAVGPDYVRPETDLPDLWRAEIQAEVAGEQPDLTEWWTAFDDTLLTALIERSGENNKDLARAVARIAEARALRGVSKADLFPQVQGAGGWSRTQQSENSGLGLLAPDGLPPTNAFELSLEGSWEIDVFGRVRRGVEAATAEVEATIEDWRDVQVALYAETARSYFEVRTLQSRLAFARENAESQTGSLEITRSRFDAGLTSALDVAQAQANLATTLSTIPTLETALTRARNRVAVLLGEPPGSVDAVLAPARPLPAPTRPVATGIPADLLRRRPDVRRAERGLAAQTARIGVAKADLYPRFTLPGFLGFQAEDSGDLFDSGSLIWGFLPQFRWNLFTAGKVRNRVRAEESRTEQALRAYEQTILLALEEVENALTAYDREQQRRDRLREAVDAASRSVDLVRTQYLSGLTNFQNYLDSQRTLFQRQDELAASEGLVVQNLVALNRALGGGWSVDQPIPGLDDQPLGRAASVQGEDGER